ncbi:hypothetical protein BOW53_14450 [Solemya pervernicosa gill symbiont]|uniref:EamA domain-containing protein n=2 Tax=Gammaproteobacteria incertae sedis TaxID=118884 RepID=A0A1T2L0X1_9GAMM|nr:DMT family transporter [Candidatus Reidiella endopervernicosa]OOZ38721.1 hypothetical protein BOW53_14450 [Solemya pervernicosa gill symbiont]QKQ25832.1 DMT family transporter [Candidatus Reidiella endopervernicosa]
MSVPAAYLGVILIWSTTPLTIKWSGDEGGVLFALLSRMVIGVIACLPLLYLLRVRMRWDREALYAYLVSGLGVFSTMSTVYWGAQYVSSGLLSLLYGLSPVVIALISAAFVGSTFSSRQMAGIVVAFSGLLVIFGGGAELGSNALLGVSFVLLSVLFYSISAVWLKRVQKQMAAMAVNFGGLLFALPLFTVSWLLFEDGVIYPLSERALWSTLYLGIFGTAFGFTLYYYVLKRIDATLAGMITQITPVVALILGALLNGEMIANEVAAGAVLILSGVGLFQLRAKKRMQREAG